MARPLNEEYCRKVVQLLHRAYFFVATLAFLVAGTTSAHAERRVALVIGNGSYQNVPKLDNPRRDAESVSATLRGLGFDRVETKNDLTREQLNVALRDFAREVDKADWALVYFAGHGIEFGGVNYMIPVDARLQSDRDVEFEAIDLGRVLTAVDTATKLRIVILDACRDNPFVKQMKRTVASRSIGRGLGQVEPESGTLVVYSTKHGQVALDGDGTNSPFVSALVKRMQTPNLEVRRMFDLVRDDVVRDTRRQQQPFTYGSVSGSEDFFFRRTAATPAPVPSPSPSPSPPPAPAPAVVAPPAPVAPAPAPAPVAWTARDCPHCPEMVSIPLGSFVMGAASGEEEREKVPQDLRGRASPQRTVTISQRFSMGRYEVTRSEYGAFVNATGRSSKWNCYGQSGNGWRSDLSLSWSNPGFEQTARDPVVCVSWSDARAYVQWLSGLTGKTYRLPSEAEWEYAARVGAHAARYWGDLRNQACRHANVADRTTAQKMNWNPDDSDHVFQCSDNFAYTAPVGKFEANGFGLHDMLGNVWEWVQDCHVANYVGAPSTQEVRFALPCSDRVMRGGGWRDFPHHVRSASRASDGAEASNNYVGFRVVRDD